MAKEKQRKSSFEDISSYSTNKAIRKNRKKKKKTGIVAVLSILFALLILLGTGLIAVSAFAVDRLTVTKIAQDAESLGISGTKARREGVVNVALFGVDTDGEKNKDGVLTGTGAAIAVISVDSVQKEIKLIALHPDTKIEPEEGEAAETGYDTLGRAYVYGGPELALRTLNRTYGLDLCNYIAVDLNTAAELADLLGGVAAELTEEEIRQINETMAVLYPELSEDRFVQSQSGYVHLTGAQAAAFGLVRNGEDDVLYPVRQLETLSGFLQKLKEVPKDDYPTVLPSLLSMLETSFSLKEIVRMLGVMGTEYSVSHLAIPGDALYCEMQTGEDGEPVWNYDPELAEDIIHSFIYETEMT